jgi:hypothetical protein
VSGRLAHGRPIRAHLIRRGCGLVSAECLALGRHRVGAIGFPDVSTGVGMFRRARCGALRNASWGRTSRGLLGRQVNHSSAAVMAGSGSAFAWSFGFGSTGRPPAGWVVRRQVHQTVRPMLDTMVVGGLSRCGTAWPRQCGWDLGARPALASGGGVCWWGAALLGQDFVRLAASFAWAGGCVRGRARR